jgi:RimJ/RimL family protein N-acetyltransferase
MAFPPLLRGERVRLTALTPDDIPTVTAWYQDDDFLRLLDARPAFPQAESALRDWLDEQNKSGDAFLFAVRLNENDALIGYVSVDGILWAHGSGWLTIAIGDPVARGQGYGPEAVGLALNFAFREMNLHRIQLTVFSYNTRAIAAYERLGFTREGTYREALRRDGRRYDMYLYGILRPEWEARMSDT